ncbi:protein RIK-like isoform X3 [Carya illinoinensis]|uniref:protein RIK-like isoform X3 n=1 Tax=Carya illinoinensis TaxID=32201 RepID=UPI001C719639|nr:protein RIK-like isoform X3 [Carya illinoinensis]
MDNQEMTEDNGDKHSLEEASQTRRRKKRKWDQPAESLVSAGVAIPGVLPLGNMGPLQGIALPGVAPVSTALLTNPLVSSCATIPLVLQASSIQQQTATMVPKRLGGNDGDGMLWKSKGSKKPKIQDELIAREIVINDAESSVRYKLTKRQTQEEIQKCTGAVVITRGKYHPPNAPLDGEKPLYLHISAGAQLKDTAERIIAVDRAAAMVEEILKQGPNLQPASSTFHLTISNGVKALSTCVFLGFDPDPSLNIAARIRGPNDQYINHIMNETGATVSLRGRGSGDLESTLGEEGQQPLHLFLSSNNPKGVEDAKRLAENLLDTISVECGASRVSSCKVYSAVPPPQQVYNAVPPPRQLLAGVLSSGNEVALNADSSAGLTAVTVGSTPAPPVSSRLIPGLPPVFSQGTVSQSGGYLHCGQSQGKVVGYSHQVVSAGTSYSGYGGIYPQATPLQQVALALRQSPSPVNSGLDSTTSIPSKEPKSSVSSDPEKEKQPPQKRKFLELPAGSKYPAKLHQGSEYLKPAEPSPNLGVRNVSTMPAPKKLVQSLSNGMRPPLPRDMPPPPPPPKFPLSTHAFKGDVKNNILNKTKSDAVTAVPDTLVKLMEYGEEDDDLEENYEELLSGNSSALDSNSGSVAARKPFWAL